jgi:hypothetical protein
MKKSFTLLATALVLSLLGACSEKTSVKEAPQEPPASKIERTALSSAQPSMSKCKVVLGRNGLRCKGESEPSQPPVFVNPITGQVDAPEK